MPKQHFEVFSDENISGVAFKNKTLKRAIINFLDNAGNATVAELNKEFNISTPKIITLVNELIHDGVIKDYGKVNSTGGRRASVYGLLAEAGFFIGVDIKRYCINIGLLDFKKNLVTIKENIPYKLENTPESFQALLKSIKQFISELPIRRNKILGIGINLSGRVNHASGYSYSYFHFQEEPLTSIIESELKIQTFLENDSRAMAYGEFCCGEVHSEKNVLYVNMDYGIGLGILIDGKIYYGKSGFSGEFGHIPFFNNEIICHCGKKGCLETEASGSALLRIFKEKVEAGTTSQLAKKYKHLDEIKLHDLIEAAYNEDMLCIDLIAQIGEKIGRGLGVLINLFNPELVILGGMLAKTGDYIRLPIKSALNKYSLSLVNNDSQLRISKLGEKAGVIGACLMARNKVFNK
ncbi:ROK family protein [Flavisolibacter tropicus]|uniref:Transcriptional regulator n=1 Tax=Flavisolibacter tropicus TaxID=1492898 RepID=A0A172TSC9_9BACT|nr:ROK family transcriptional regulator [Flavisolibacter tropicus]ANE49995.1 transcriptional regulator [Flavisolibacter tropicus]